MENGFIKASVKSITNFDDEIGLPMLRFPSDAVQHDFIFQSQIFYSAPIDLQSQSFQSASYIHWRFSSVSSASWNSFITICRNLAYLPIISLLKSLTIVQNQFRVSSVHTSNRLPLESIAWVSIDCECYAVVAKFYLNISDGNSSKRNLKSQSCAVQDTVQ